MASHDAKIDGMIRNLRAKTGRSLEEWVALTIADGPATPADRRDWLKTTHGLGHFQARLVVSRIAD